MSTLSVGSNLGHDFKLESFKHNIIFNFCIYDVLNSFMTELCRALNYKINIHYKIILTIPFQARSSLCYKTKLTLLGELFMLLNSFELFQPV